MRSSDPHHAPEGEASGVDSRAVDADGNGGPFGDASAGLRVPPEGVVVGHTVSDVLAAKGLGAGPAAGSGVASGGPTREATPPAAIVMIMVAVMGFVLLDVSAKSLTTTDGRLASGLGVEAPVPSVLVVWMRFLVHVALMGLLMGALARRPILRVRSWPWQIVRATCMFVATLFNFLALNHLQLAETIAVFFAAPMVVTALAGPLLGEWVGWRRWAAIVVGFGGVLLIARPGTELFQPAFLLSVTSMLGYSFYVLLTRKLSATEGPDSLLFISALVPALLLAPAVPATGAWVMPEGWGTWALLVSLGLYGVGGHFLFVRAYGLASTGALAPFTYVQIPFAVLVGWLVFGDLPDRWTVAGIAVIAAAGLYIMLRERALAKAEAAMEARTGAREGAR